MFANLYAYATARPGPIAGVVQTLEGMFIAAIVLVAAAVLIRRLVRSLRGNICCNCPFAPARLDEQRFAQLRPGGRSTEDDGKGAGDCPRSTCAEPPPEDVPPSRQP